MNGDGGFRSGGINGNAYGSINSVGIYDTPHIAITYASLASLRICGYDIVCIRYHCIMSSCRYHLKR